MSDQTKFGVSKIGVSKRMNDCSKSRNLHRLLIFNWLYWFTLKQQA